MAFPLLGVRPRLVPTLFVGAAFLILLGLGTWQVERLAWKTDLLRTIATHMSAEPRALTGPSWGQVDDYERVRVEGHFMHDREFHMLARSVPGGELGYQILTPLAVDGGGTVIVNRGYVPTDRQDPGTRLAGQVQGPVSVSGVVHYPHAPALKWFIPDNRPAENFWLWPDLASMATTSALGAVAPFVIDADATPNPGGLPVGGQTQLDIPNDHLQYAITWYSLALILVVMFVIYHRRRKDGEKANA
jgi:surfeit locus 1 family protein